MAILKVARLGNPVLRKVAGPVDRGEITRPDFQRFIDDMIETMHEYDGVGLAAPQVHVSRQIAVIESRGNSRYPDGPGIPLHVVINPTVVSRSDKKQIGWEGCLSVDDLRGQVARSTRMEVRALDRQGREVTLDATGFFAVVMQHELDHLMGKVYMDRMADLSTLTYLGEYARYWMKEDS